MWQSHCTHLAGHSINIGGVKLGSAVPGAELMQRQICLCLKEPGLTDYWAGSSVTRGCQKGCGYTDGLSNATSLSKGH
jgi:hypothetical protein